MSIYPRWQDGDRWLKTTETARLLSVPRPALKTLMRDPFDPLPAPFPVGKRNRWLASQVWEWMERRMRVQTAPNERVEPIESYTPQPSISSTDELRNLYEGGMTLDAICREKKIGKARLLGLLRDAGVKMRRPGRPSSSLLKHLPREESL